MIRASRTGVSSGSVSSARMGRAFLPSGRDFLFARYTTLELVDDAVYRGSTLLGLPVVLVDDMPKEEVRLVSWDGTPIT